MHSNLWNDTQTESGSTDASATVATTDTDGSPNGEQSPLDAAIEASSWSRADIELALNAVQVVLLVVWLYLAYHE